MVRPGGCTHGPTLPVLSIGMKISIDCDMARQCVADARGPAAAQCCCTFKGSHIAEQAEVLECVQCNAVLLCAVHRVSTRVSEVTGTNCGNAQVPEGERGGKPATTAGHTGHQGPAAGLPFRRYLFPFGLHLAHPFSCDLLVIARELDEAKSCKINIIIT